MSARSPTGWASPTRPPSAKRSAAGSASARRRSGRGAPPDDALMSPAPSHRARAVAVTIGAALMLYAVFIVGLPWLILSMTRGVPSLALPIGPLRWLGLPLVAFGLYLYVWSLVKLLQRDTSALPGV